jgi:hypothetical protein
MMDHDQEKHLDELLDSALSAYSSAEPRPGLETRILAQVREASGTPAPLWRGWRWLWAGALTAIAALFIALWMGRHAQVQPPTNNIVRSDKPPAQPAPSPTHHAKIARDRRPESSTPAAAANPANHRRREHGALHPQPVAAAVPRQPVFPASTPLSEQEKLLLSYYAQTPREELIAQSRPDEPPVAAEDQSDIAVPEMIFVPQKSSNTR